jgi:hypothetical protein
MPQSIVEQITDGMELWEKAVGLKPNVCYLGKYEMEQWLLANDKDLKMLDITFQQVSARNYLGFGV